MEFMELSELTDSEIAKELRRERLLLELALTEEDLTEMGYDQRALVEDIISKVLNARAQHA